MKLKQIFCRHSYELVAHNPVYVLEPMHVLDQRKPSYYQWIYVCRKCGKRKRMTDK